MDSIVDRAHLGAVTNDGHLFPYGLQLLCQAAAGGKADGHQHMICRDCLASMAFHYNALVVDLHHAGGGHDLDAVLFQHLGIDHLIGGAAILHDLRQHLHHGNMVFLGEAQLDRSFGTDKAAAHYHDVA